MKYRWLAILPVVIAAVVMAVSLSEPKQAVTPKPDVRTGSIVVGPYVQPAGTDLTRSLNVVWWSDELKESRIAWSFEGSSRGGTSLSVQEPYEGWYRHSVRIDRPKGAGDTVQLLMGGKVPTGLKIRFLPERGEAFRFAATGDIGAGTDGQRAVAEQMLKNDVRLVLVPGDIVYGSGTWNEYNRNFHPYYKDLMRSAVFAPVLGNHDPVAKSNMGGPYRRVFTPPANWNPYPNEGRYVIEGVRANNTSGPVLPTEETLRNYSFDVGYVHFLCIDSTADKATLEKLIVPWAKLDLESAKQHGAKWIIAQWHHPPYTRGAYRDNSRQLQEIRDTLVPLAREGGVRVVLNGHDHNYQHMEKDGIHYIVTGAGGAKLYDVKPDYTGYGQPPLLGWNDKVHSFTMFDLSPDGKTLKVAQIAQDGTELDTFTLTAS